MSEPDEWISASAAKAMGPEGPEFCQAIIERAKHGLVRARAKHFISFGENGETRHEDYDVPPFLWEKCQEGQNWLAGNFITYDLGQLTDQWFDEHSTPYWKALDVSFAKADIEKILPADIQSRSTSSGVSNRSKGGAPGKYDWARAVGTLIFEWSDNGNWHPTSQGEVKKRLASWFGEQNQSPDDSQLKSYARWLFEEFQKRST